MAGDQLSRENSFRQAMDDWETLMLPDVVSETHGKSLWMMPIISFIVIVNLIANLPFLIINPTERGDSH